MLKENVTLDEIKSYLHTFNYHPQIKDIERFEQIFDLRDETALVEYQSGATTNMDFIEEEFKYNLFNNIKTNCIFDIDYQQELIQFRLHF